MKKLMTFDNFNKSEKLTEFVETQTPADKINTQIEKCIGQFKDNPESFMKYDEVKLRESLLKKAQENKFRGDVTIKKSPRTGKNHIIYYPKNSTLQDLGASASGAIKTWENKKEDK